MHDTVDEDAKWVLSSATLLTALAPSRVAVHTLDKGDKVVKRRLDFVKYVLACAHSMQNQVQSWLHLSHFQVPGVPRAW